MEEVNASNEKFKAMIMIKRADGKRFNDLKRRLREASDVGRDEYPTTVAGAYDLLVRTQDQIRNVLQNKTNTRFGGGDRTKIMFAQVDNGDENGCVMVPGLDGTINPKMTCWHCNKQGHGRENCPDNPSASGRNADGKKRRISNFMRGFNFAQRNKVKSKERYAELPSSWVLLDTCSTVDVTNNPDHVTDIQRCNSTDEMKIVTNGGSLKFHHEANLKLLPLKVYYNEYSMATIISLASILDLKDHYATMDSREELAILVYKPNGEMLKFKQCKDGLYYLDMNRADLYVFNYSKHDLKEYYNYNLLQTVSSKKEFLAKKEIEGAENARREQEIIGWPATSTYKSYLANNLLNNSTITVDDVNRALDIHGEPEPLLEGKMVRPKPQVFGKIKRCPLPPPILKNYPDIQIHVDFFFVNRMPFLHTKSDKLNFLTVERMKNRTKAAIIGSITDAINIYKLRGFQVSFMHGDGEFDVADLKTAILPTEAVIYGKNEHVPVVERSIRTIKERCRATCRAAPYTRYTSLMTQHLVESRVSWLNRFPSKNGVSDTMSPASIVLGHGKPDMKIKRIPFGGYAVAYTQTSNDMRTRGTPAIALSESNNKGGQYFMSLYSGKKIHAYAWEELNPHEDVITRVHELAELEDQPILVDKSPLFEWAPGVTIDYGTENVEFQQQQDAVEQSAEDEFLIDVDQHPTITDEENENEFDEQKVDNSAEGVDHEHDEEIDNALEEERFVLTDDDMNQNDKETHDDEEQQNNATNNVRPRRTNAGAGVERFEPRFGQKTYELNRRLQYMQLKRKKKAVQLMQVKSMMQKVRKDVNAPSYLQRAVEVIFTQLEDDEQKFKDMPASKGMKLFGERAVAACIKEFSQLSNGVVPGKPVIQPVNLKDVTREERLQALEAVNLIKQKRCGKVKFRSCVNGSEQWKYLKEDDNIASPTLQLEALFLSMMIDVFEG